MLLLYNQAMGIGYMATNSQFMKFWYLSHMQAAKAHLSLGIRIVSPASLLLAHTNQG